MIEKQMIDKTKETGFTQFRDIHSGGNQKLEWSMIYVNLPETQAKMWFSDKFDRDCDHITCSCCGKDYSVYSDDNLEKLTHYHRHRMWVDKQYVSNMSYNEYKKLSDTDVAISLSDYLAMPDVLYVEIDRI